MLFITVAINCHLFVKLDGLGYLTKANGLFDQLGTDRKCISDSRYLERTDLFKRTPLEGNATIFLGDSLTERCNWDELLGNESIRNRGIGSDTTYGVYNRLEPILDSKPDKVFLMVGINDLAKGYDVQTITKRYEQIIAKIYTDSPSTAVYIQSVLPVRVGSVRNSDVIKLNQNLKSISETYGFQYIDLFTPLSDESNCLLSGVTEDGIHLNGSGYIIWKDEIMQYI